MAKKKLILSQEQVEKICEGEEFVYLSDLASKPDVGDIYSTEVTTDGSIEDGYPIPSTTDDRSHTMTNDWRGNAKLAGVGAMTIREMSKKDWAKQNVVCEESEHGNSRLLNRQFGDGSNRKSYTAAKMSTSRLNNAEEKLNSTDPQVRASGAKTIERMKQNNPGIEVMRNQYEGAKLGDKVTQKNKIGPKMASAPKQSGNGKAHSPKNGVFLN
jgi:hypothetical protein